MFSVIGAHGESVEVEVSTETEAGAKIGAKDGEDEVPMRDTGGENGECFTR